MFPPVDNNKMPRTPIDLDAHKDTIISLYLQGHSVDDVRQHLFDQGIKLGDRTLRTRLSQWNISKKIHTDDTPELRLRIATLFYQCAFKDEDILDVLRQEGFKIQPRALRRIRKKMGLIRRLPGRDREEADKKLLAVVEAELNKGKIEAFGRSHLYYHFRSQQHIVSRFVTLILFLNQYTNIVLLQGPSICNGQTP